MGSSRLWAFEDENIDIANIDRPFKDRIACPLSDKKKIHYTENICEFDLSNCVSTWCLNGRRAYKSLISTKFPEQI